MRASSLSARSMLRAFFVAVACLLSQSAWAGPYSLSGDQRWIALASRQDLNQAIGIAQTFIWRLSGVRVMQSANGWYAVVAGPHDGTDIRAVRQKLSSTGTAPKDMALSKGDAYVAEVWTKKAPEFLFSGEYEGGEKPALYSYRDLNLTLSRVRSKDNDDYDPTFSASRNGKILFNVQIEELNREEPRSDVIALRLDPAIASPQFVFTAFTGGAHCCTETRFITQAGEAWRVVEGEILDAGGYWFEDIDGDGIYEILSADNSFYYAYASYADSRAPIRIHVLRDGVLLDVTNDPKYESLRRQKIHAMEFEMTNNSELATSNGFLAAWVATKALVGELDEAWARMMGTYNSSSDWPLSECMVELDAKGLCPPGKEIALSYPSALRKHLEKSGYIQTAAKPAAASAPAVKITPAPPTSVFSLPP